MPHIPLEEDFTLVVKPSRRGINPPHLREYQEKMRRVAPICVQETQHLKGDKRVVDFYTCVARKMKKNGSEGENNNLR